MKRILIERPAPRTLAELKPSQSAVLAGFTLPAETASRLMEVGFLPGLTVTARVTAPGGDPLIFDVDGTLLAVRRETARHVTLEAAAAAPVGESEGGAA